MDDIKIMRPRPRLRMNGTATRAARKPARTFNSIAWLNSASGDSRPAPPPPPALCTRISRPPKCDAVCLDEVFDFAGFAHIGRVGEDPVGRALGRAGVVWAPGPRSSLLEASRGGIEPSL